MDLFREQKIPMSLSDGRLGYLRFWPNWMPSEEADLLLARAIKQTPWRHDSIRMMGRKIPIPRLQNWFGTPGTNYTYSNIRLEALEFPPWMDRLRRSIEIQTNSEFNRALVNYYRDGNDSVDWHADDEASLGNEPMIASFSLGVARKFDLRHNLTGQRVSLNLPHGSLLLMGPGLQSFWKHRIPKSRNLSDARVNFTFRYMRT
jgi:alkylated DNA repair dioxygenase AlkB